MAASLSMVNATKALEFAISEPVDCAAAQQSARRMAMNLGFAEGISEEVALAVAELTSNLVKHADHGVLILRPLENNGRTGIEIEASDHGPGIPDVEQSFADGYSTSGSLGYGLGTVNRPMDEMEPGSSADDGHDQGKGLLLFICGTSVFSRAPVGAHARMAMPLSSRSGRADCWLV